jgi:hypothetical protein
LIYLVRLPLASPGLQVEDFLHSCHRENVMIARDAFLEPELVQQATKRTEVDIGVTTPHHDVLKQLLVCAHDINLPCDLWSRHPCGPGEAQQVIVQFLDIIPDGASLWLCGMKIRVFFMLAKWHFSAAFMDMLLSGR